MTQAHSVEPLSKQVITYLSDYCKTGLDGIEYYPALHSFDLYFNIESLVGPFIKRNDFKIHVQKPYMIGMTMTTLYKLNFHVFAKLDLTFATLLIQMELEH